MLWRAKPTKNKRKKSTRKARRKNVHINIGRLRAWRAQNIVRRISLSASRFIRYNHIDCVRCICLDDRNLYGSLDCCYHRWTYVFWSFNFQHLKSSICGCHLEKWIGLGRRKSLESCVPLIQLKFTTIETNSLTTSFNGATAIEMYKQQVSLSHSICAQVCRFFCENKNPEKKLKRLLVKKLIYFIEV